jgi:signal transduction histidine kinase
LRKARDPFFTTRPTGTGLGLAIVERVMRGHEGTLEVTSEPGKGTTVRLVFPAWSAALETPSAVAASLRESRA